METIASQLHRAFAAAIRDAFGFDADPLIGLSQNAQFGDYQSNAAMGLAKLVAEKTGQKTNPRQVAEQIKAKLSLGDIATETSIAGPGFINVKLNPAWLNAQVNTIVREPEFVFPAAPKRQTVIVDYSGVNIAKEMHVGHLRSTIIGDAIANVLERLGHNVIRRNHLGDWGTQFGMLIAFLNRANAGKSALAEGLHVSNVGFAGENGALVNPSTIFFINDLESFYRAAKQLFDSDTAFQKEARDTVVRLQAHQKDEMDRWEQIVNETRKHYQSVYEQLGVRLTQNDERGESFYNHYLSAVVGDLTAAGIAVESDGAMVVFVDGTERSPLIIRKSDGGYLYGTTDLAAIRYRINEEHAERIIYTHDSRQAQHFSQVFRTADKAGWTHGGEVKLEYAPFGTMLGEDGKPFKTRSGDVVKLKELLDEAEERGYKLAKSKDDERVTRAREKGEDATPFSDELLHDIGKKVGIGGVKYADLSKDRTSDYVFNWDKMLSFEGNTAPYLQYVYARIQSIFRKAAGSAGGKGTIALESPFELALAKHILRMGEIVELVAKELKPHLLCTYLYELASKFSGFYENCDVLKSDEPTRSSRLALCDVTAKTMALGLDLLGIEHPDQM
ncbi:arginine--tRNA ligase [soil metagenome]